MKHTLKKASIILATALQVATVTNVMAQKTTADQPPLIQRELFFDNPEIAGSQLSPDGKMISFLKANKGIMNIWVKAFNEPFDKARPLTASAEPVGGYFWTDDGKYILFTEAKGGNENDNIYAVDPMAKADAATGIPAARNLTPNDKVKAYIYSVSKKNPDVLWIGMNDRDASWHDLYKLEISTGKLTLLEQNKDRLAAWIFDWDENIRMAMRSPEDGSTELLKREKDGSYTKVYECGALESCSPLGFTKDNKGVYIETNKGADVNLSKLVLMDMGTLKITDAEKDPLNKVDFGTAFFSERSHELLLTTYTDAKTKVYYKDAELEKDAAFIKAKFPGMEMNYNNFTKNEDKFLFSISSDTKLPEVYFFDRKKREMVFQYSPRPKLKPFEKYFSEMQPVTYKSSDGLEIPGYLTLPKDFDSKNLPLVVMPHGGPWARDYWGFNGFAQWLANRGYAVLQMNFRGSYVRFSSSGSKC
jgi:dipeptidyl aminopeptidase/acylaminoacyl peptidase